MSLQDLLPAIRPVFSEFNRLEIPYYVGGSVASSIYGEPRSTLDIDIGADLPESAIHGLVSKWDSDFYVSETAMRDAVQRGSSFKLIHLSTSLKVDIFVCGTDAFNASVMKRRQSRVVAIGEETLSICIATPEDVILHKLVWYRKSGDTSERQWQDIFGVVKQQQDQLDGPYLSDWAERRKVGDLWERIRDENPIS